ncbi:hypothetical protein IW262DRAFT_1299308 [Armillaria fumosa]|nr:hypothetical protein IW262DRAFT_1299308 [Armillaria fumosa]
MSSEYTRNVHWFSGLPSDSILLACRVLIMEFNINITDNSGCQEYFPGIETLVGDFLKNEEFQFVSLGGTTYNEFHLPFIGSSFLNEFTTASNPFIPRILVEDGQKLYPSVGATGVEKLLFRLAAELRNNIIHGDGALQLTYFVRLEDHPSEDDAQTIQRILHKNPLTFIVLSASTLASRRHVSFSSKEVIMPEDSGLDHAAQLFVPSELLIQSSDASSYL